MRVFVIVVINTHTGAECRVETDKDRAFDLYETARAAYPGCHVYIFTANVDDGQYPLPWERALADLYARRSQLPMFEKEEP